MFSRFRNQIARAAARAKPSRNEKDRQRNISSMGEISTGVTSIAAHLGQASRAQQFRHYAFAHPFRAYLKLGSVTFGGVFLANSLSGMFMDEPPLSPYVYPQGFALGTLAKSLFFGMCWPSVPYMLLGGKDARRDLCVLGGGIQRELDDLKKRELVVNGKSYSSVSEWWNSED